MGNMAYMINEYGLLVERVIDSHHNAEAWTVFWVHQGTAHWRTVFAWEDFMESIMRLINQTNKVTTFKVTWCDKMGNTFLLAQSADGSLLEEFYQTDM